MKEGGTRLVVDIVQIYVLNSWGGEEVDEGLR